MHDQVIQRPGFAITGKSRVLDVALDDATALQQSADTRGDPLDQNLQLGPGRLRHMAEHGRGAVDWQVHARLKQA